MHRNALTLLSAVQRYTLWICCFVVALAVPVVLRGAGTGSNDEETFSAVADIQIPCIPQQVPCLGPNNQYGFDISFVDPQTDLLFVTDASNKALDVIQASTRTFLFFVTSGTVNGKPVGFTGQGTTFDLPHLGPDGVVSVSPTEVWVGDGDSAVKVVDLLSRQITDAIPTGGTTRADELAYDPRDHVILIGNPDEGTRTPPQAPFLSLISTKTHKILQRFPFPNATGIEQPSWSPDTGLFYVSIPSLDGNAGHSGVAVIDPRIRKLVRIFPTGDCDPNGSAIGPNGQLLLGCSGPTTEIMVLNIYTGQITTFTNTGNADEVWFNPGDDHYYIAANAFGPTPNSFLGVFDSNPLEFDAPLVSTPGGSHSITGNPATNQIFVPIGGDPADSNCLNGCVRVYTARGKDHDEGENEGGR